MVCCACGYWRTGNNAIALSLAELRTMNPPARVKSIIIEEEIKGIFASKWWYQVAETDKKLNAVVKRKVRLMTHWNLTEETYEHHETLVSGEKTIKRLNITTLLPLNKVEKDY